VKVCVAGLWHLGSVTAACLDAGGHDVTGWDGNDATIAALSAGQPPVFEPGLAELVAQGIAAGRLRFTTDRQEALRGAEVLWIAYDTPVDDDDNADVARNAFSACFVISADSTDIHSMRSVNGASSCATFSRSLALRTPATTRSGLVKTSIAFPRRRFSGE